ncbi:MAG: laccase domain-containing protein [Patescibacteria group bacterium]|nr:laccase domain-containing protein [Patescibacteria group bacterium]
MKSFYKKLHKVKFLNSQTGFSPQLRHLINHGFSWGKESGNMDFAFGDSLGVRLRIQQFLTDLHMGSIRDSINMIPEHSDRIVDIDKTKTDRLKRHRFGKNINCDAVFTKRDNITLTTKPADCTTAFVFAQNLSKETIIGIIHSGRRGVEMKLPQKAVAHICQKYHCKSDNILLSVVPHLFQENRRFENIDDLDASAWKGFIKKREGYFYPDETGLAIKQYLDSRISQKNLEVHNIDTFEEAHKGNTFSYKYHLEIKKKGGKAPEGRFIVAIRKK